MDTIKMLSVNEAFFPHEGGAERRSYELFRRLGKKGFDIEVLTNPFGTLEQTEGLNIRNITTLREQDYFRQSSRKIRGVLNFSSSVRKALAGRRDYDILNFDEFPLYHAVKSQEEIRRSPVSFFHWHEVLKDFYSRKGLIWKLAINWERKVANLFTNHIAVSRTVRDLLKATYPISDVSVIANGVDRKAFQSNGKKDWGKIIYVGRLEPHKRLDSLIRAMDGMNGLELHVIGNGSQSNFLKSIIDGKKNISLHGHMDQDELMDYFRKAWLFVLPSYREGFSIASIEAMAASIPVVTVRSEYNYAANEVIKNGYNGLISTDFVDLMSRIRYLYNNEEEWNMLSRNALEFTADYDWDTIADEMAKLYSSKVLQ